MTAGRMVFLVGTAWVLGGAIGVMIAATIERDEPTFRVASIVAVGVLAARSIAESGRQGLR